MSLFLWDDVCILPIPQAYTYIQCRYTAKADDIGVYPIEEKPLLAYIVCIQIKADTDKLPPTGKGICKWGIPSQPERHI
jgi:hypothetical protein